MKPISVIKSSGVIQNEEEVRNKLFAGFSLLANGNYTITVTKQTRKRSIDQNAMMWWWWGIIEKSTGQDKNDIHDYFCSRFIDHRIVSFNGKNSNVTGRTSSLNTKQFGEFLDKVHAEVSTELGIRLPLPNDRFFDDYMNEYYNNL